MRDAFVALAGVAAGLGVSWLVANRGFGPDELNAPQSWLLGWSFIGGGLIAVRVRPQNQRLGWAMVFTGFAWFCSLLMLAHDSPLFTIGAAMQVVYIAGFAYVVVSFPSGRLDGRAERLVIGAAVFLVAVVQVVSLPFTDSKVVFCSGCPSNALEVARNDTLAKDLHQFQRAAGVLVILAAIALLALRWWRASEAQRRLVAPVLWAGAATFLLAAVAVANETVGKPLGHAPLRLMLFAIAAVPVAILFAFLQRRMARGAVAGLVVELGDPAASLDLRGGLGSCAWRSVVGARVLVSGGARYVDGGRKAGPVAGVGRRAAVDARRAGRAADRCADPRLGAGAQRRAGRLGLRRRRAHARERAAAG